jgi:hypothetical protein
VLHRSLDVIFQYLVPLVLVLVAVPTLVLGISVATDRTQLVEARLWADQPAILADSPFAAGDRSVTPAQSQATLLTELLQTDSFVATALRQAHSSANPTKVADDVRHNLYVVPLGPHVVQLTYATAQPRDAVAFTGAVITAFQEAQQSVQSGQVSVADSALKSQLQTSRKDMEEALAALQKYQSSRSPDSLANDATYLSMRALALLKINNYTTVVQEADRTSQFQSAIPTVQPTVLRTLDPPQLQSWQVKLKGSPSKNAGYALAAVVAIELIFVYNLTRRDQRVRTTREVVSSLGLVSLGTTPDPKPR